MLRIKTGCLAWADPEKFRVEQVHTLKKSTIPGCDLARCVGVGIVVGVDVPAISWDLSDCVAALTQQRPERIRIVAAGKSAGEPDHGDGLTPSLDFRFQFANLRLQRIDCEYRFPQLVGGATCVSHRCYP